MGRKKHDLVIDFAPGMGADAKFNGDDRGRALLSAPFTIRHPPSRYCIHSVFQPVGKLIGSMCDEFSNPLENRKGLYESGFVTRWKTDKVCTNPALLPVGKPIRSV